MTPILQAEGLTVRARGKALLDGVSFSLAPGAFVAVLGPNGAGKSTLLRALCGLVPCEGRVVMAGRAFGDAGPRARLRMRRRIGYVPQLTDAALSPLPMTVREVVAMGRLGRAGLLQRNTAEDRRACDRWLDRLGLTALADRPYAVLSGGERRKAQLARALAQEPEVLLLDEPAGHLDFYWQEILTDTVGRLWRDVGCAVVLVTHDLRHLPAGIDCVALIDRGRLLAWDAPGHLLTSERLSALFGMSLRVTRENGRYAASVENPP